MKDEYIIINRTVLEKEKEELKKTIDKYAILEARKDLYSKVDNLLSQSTPLIPEIEKGFDAGKEYGFYEAHNANSGDIPDNDTYISNLKLDI